MFTVPEEAELRDLRPAIPDAVARCARGMLEPELGEYQGLPALRRFAHEVGEWPEAAEDWRWCARFLYQVIERRGTGGGNFRLMYSRFLEEAGYAEAEQATAAAAAWTVLAAAAQAASGPEEPDSDLWRRVAAEAAAVLEAEERLWDALATVGR
jgi:hypothetical protein